MDLPKVGELRHRPIYGAASETFEDADQAARHLHLKKNVAIEADWPDGECRDGGAPGRTAKRYRFARVKGLSYEEIAVEMNCPIGTVRSRMLPGTWQAVAEELRPLLDTAPDHRW